MPFTDNVLTCISFAYVSRKVILACFFVSMRVRRGLLFVIMVFQYVFTEERKALELG